MHHYFDNPSAGITPWIFAIVVGTFTVAAAWSDVRTGKLPNWLTVSGLGAALVFQLATNLGGGLLTAIAGFAAGFSLLLVLWLTGGGGGG